MRYEMGGLIFDPDLPPDANGCEWMISELEGWDSPDLRLSVLDPTGIHGQIIGSSLYGGRPMTATGWITVPNEAGFWSARNILAAATNFVGGVSGPLIVHEAAPKKCTVVRADKLRMRNHPEQLIVEFEIPLLAPDPRKYALNGTVVSLP